MNRKYVTACLSLEQAHKNSQNRLAYQILVQKKSILKTKYLRKEINLEILEFLTNINQYDRD